LLMTVYAHKQNLIFLKNENEKSSVWMEINFYFLLCALLNVCSFTYVWI
jgi:hypothetical protein